MNFKLVYPNGTYTEFHGLTQRQFDAIQAFQGIINLSEHKDMRSPIFRTSVKNIIKNLS